MHPIRNAFAAIALFAFVGCAPAPADPPARAAAEARPALWKVADADTTIWLLGTIHVLPKDYRWRGPAINDAVRQADMLVIETVLDRADPAKAMALLTRLGVTPGLPPLVDRVPAEKRPALALLIQRSRVPEPFLNGLETWGGALMLMPVVLGDLGLGDGIGVEEQLEADFRAAKKPIDGLETPESQLGVLDTLPEPAQREFLVALADDGINGKADFDAMLAAWARGDEAAIAATFDDEVKVSPALREALLVKRNANWVGWLRMRLDKPGKVLVAVGAGHLAGDDSVVAMLKAKGVKVERVQ